MPDQDKTPHEISAHFMMRRAVRDAYEARLPSIRTEGEAALRRLLTIAQGDSGQCKRVAAFLLGCYNGDRFPFDLTDFRTLDMAIFDDCIAVLRMDYTPQQEVHTYFDNGGKLFEQLAKDWGIRDRLVTDNHDGLT